MDRREWEDERERVVYGERGRKHGTRHGGWPLFIVFAPLLWHKLFPTRTPHLGLTSKKSSYLGNKLNLKRCCCLSCSLGKQLFPCMCRSLSICTIVISSRFSSTNFYRPYLPHFSFNWCDRRLHGYLQIQHGLKVVAITNLLPLRKMKKIVHIRGIPYWEYVEPMLDIQRALELILAWFFLLSSQIWMPSLLTCLTNQFLKQTF